MEETKGCGGSTGGAGGSSSLTDPSDTDSRPMRIAKAIYPHLRQLADEFDVLLEKGDISELMRKCYIASKDESFTAVLEEAVRNNPDPQRTATTSGDERSEPKEKEIVAAEEEEDAELDRLKKRKRKKGESRSVGKSRK